jgi:hypothetical protein
MNTATAIKVLADTIRHGAGTEEDAVQLLAISDVLAKKAPIQATPEIVDLLTKYKSGLPAFPPMLKRLEVDGVIEYNPQYVRQLKHAAKIARGWKPNPVLMWMEKHPDIMSSVSGALPVAGLTGTLAGMSTKSAPTGLAVAAGGFAGGVMALYSLRKLLRASGRKFRSPHWPLDLGYKKKENKEWPSKYTSFM